VGNSKVLNNAKVGKLECACVPPHNATHTIFTTQNENDMVPITAAV
jgi:hypothetical protein